MGFDPAIVKQLQETFRSELSEQSQIMTENLLILEKDLNNQEAHETLLRSAHNIKGAARGVGIMEIGDVAHRLETLFIDIKANKIKTNQSVIDVCLMGIDVMQNMIEEFIAKGAISFDVKSFLSALENTQSANSSAELTEKKPITVEPKTSQNNKTAKTIPAQTQQDSIKVLIKNIEKLSAMVEDLHIYKIAYQDLLSEFLKINSELTNANDNWSKLYSFMINEKDPEKLERYSHEVTDDLTELSNNIRSVFKQMKDVTNAFTLNANAFQSEITDLRLMPASSILQTFPRYTREVANQLGKEINFEMSGEDVRLDKVVLDRLKDPLIHLLRNAIDHGIEDKNSRIEKNKKPEGTIQLSFREQGNDIIISLKDDGRGVNIDSVLQKAEQLKMITPQDKTILKEPAILELLFHPGFTTKDQATDLSGRGVGLDIVKNNILKLKGHISISTKQFQGSEFTIKVPRTISSEQALLIKVSNKLFAVPAFAVHRVLRVPAREFIEINGNPVIKLDERPIAICSLSSVLNLEVHHQDEENLTLLVIEDKNIQKAFVVDEIIGQREMIIKSLQPPLDRVKNILGATLLERNQVAIVLDPEHLLSSSSGFIAIEESEGEIMTEELSEESKSILVVDDSITTRTLEKNILEGKNFKVTVAVNGKEAWDILQKQKFALMITDVMMPIMDGFTLTDRVKKNEKLKNMPVIIITSLGSDSEKARGIEVGADAYIVKSDFESDVLLDVVNQLI